MWSGGPLKYDPGAEVSTREISLQLPGKTDGGNKGCESEENSANERAEANVRNESQSAGQPSLGSGRKPNLNSNELGLEKASCEQRNDISPAFWKR